MRTDLVMSARILRSARLAAKVGSDDRLQLISQKTKLAEAIRYALRASHASSAMAASRSTPMWSKRSIRPIALNRKNALFAGSDAGGEHWATIAPLIET
jgi:hypothetical protein